MNTHSVFPSPGKLPDDDDEPPMSVPPLAPSGTSPTRDFFSGFWLLLVPSASSSRVAGCLRALSGSSCSERNGTLIWVIGCQKKN